jgi:hypothetical protein
MWKTLASALTGLLLTMPAAASDPVDRPILPGGCVVQNVELRGKLSHVEGALTRNPPIPFSYWELSAGGKIYRLDLGSEELLELARKLKGHDVVVAGTVKPDTGTVRVTGLKPDGFVKVEIKGTLTVDPTEILRPYNVSEYIPVGEHRYYLHFDDVRKRDTQAAVQGATVVVTGRLETSGRWLIVHVSSLVKVAEALEERAYQGWSADCWRKETILALKGGDHRPLAEIIGGLLADDLKRDGHSVRVDGDRLIVRTTAANHERINHFLDTLRMIPGSAN